MSSEDPVQDGKNQSDPRLDSLDMKLKKVREEQNVRYGKANQVPAKGMRQGNRVLTELIAGPLGGTLVGWFLDRMIGTTPWLLLLCLFLGIGVAFRNIIKISAERPE
jgi:ATP synthase protein I